MKAAVLGTGKTGGRVLELLPDASAFNSRFPLTLERLMDHDVVISFVPGEVFKTYIPLLIDSNLPVVSGTTGIEWPEDLDSLLQEKNLKWIWGSNFSLGMNLIKKLIRDISAADRLYDELNFHIHEVHHTKKLDAPSGTALSWKKWLGKEVEISSERTGDVVGIHELTLDTPEEKIEIRHEAKDRKLFAKGAIWAAQKLLEDEDINPGFHLFSDIAARQIRIT